MAYLLSIVSFFRDLPIVVKIVWLFVLFLSLIIIVLLLYLTILRHRLRKHEISRLKYIKEYKESVVNFLYAEEENSEISDAQKSIIKQLKSGLIFLQK